MTQIQVKGVPRGFEYVVTKRQAKNALRTYGELVALLVFGGIESLAQKPSFRRPMSPDVPEWHFVGVARATKGSSVWSVAVEFRAIRGESIGSDKQMVANMVLDDLRGWLERLGTDGLSQSKQITLGFERFKGEIRSASFE